MTSAHSFAVGIVLTVANCKVSGSVIHIIRVADCIAAILTGVAVGALAAAFVHAFGSYP